MPLHFAGEAGDFLLQLQLSIKALTRSSSPLEWSGRNMAVDPEEDCNGEEFQPQKVSF